MTCNLGRGRMTPDGFETKVKKTVMQLNSLSPRAVNVLGRHGIRTREQARQANVLERLAGERNCGRKTMDEIARWVENDSDQHSAPHCNGGV